MGTKMFKVGSFEQELAESMQEQLVSSQVEKKFSFERIAKAADLLHAAADIFDDTGFHEEAEVITQLLENLASGKKKVKTAAGLGDLTTDEIRFFQSLNPEVQKIISNEVKLTDTGTGVGNDMTEVVKTIKSLYKVWLQDEAGELPQSDLEVVEEAEPITQRKPEPLPAFTHAKSLLHDNTSFDIKASKKKV